MESVHLASSPAILWLKNGKYRVSHKSVYTYFHLLLSQVKLIQSVKTWGVLENSQYFLQMGKRILKIDLEMAEKIEVKDGNPNFNFFVTVKKYFFYQRCHKLP